MAAKPFAVLFLGRDVSAQGALQRGCIQSDSASQEGESQCLVLAVVLKVTAKDVLVSSDAISQKPSQKGIGSHLGLRRAT